MLVEAASLSTYATGSLVEEPGRRSSVFNSSARSKATRFSSASRLTQVCGQIGVGERHDVVGVVGGFPKPVVRNKGRGGFAALPIGPLEPSRRLVGPILDSRGLSGSPADCAGQ